MFIYSYSINILEHRVCPLFGFIGIFAYTSRTVLIQKLINKSNKVLQNPFVSLTFFSNIVLALQTKSSCVMYNTSENRKWTLVVYGSDYHRRLQIRNLAT